MTAAILRDADSSTFGDGLRPCGCASCGRAFFAPTGLIGQACPWCGQAPLAPQAAKMREAPPERIVPFGSGRQDLLPAFVRFASVRFATEDLTAANLVSRATAIWFPMWLVDATAVGSWSAEVGFDYDVQSHEESLRGGTWKTAAVIRQQVRWEPRLGAAQRRYQDVPTPALADHVRILEVLGRYDLGRSVDFTSDKLAGALLRLPDQDTEDAWPEAEEALGRALAEDCARAAGARHVRNAHATARWEDPTWTWMLLPVYATWYADDAGKRHVVLVNGQSGQVAGPAYGSMRRAWLWAGLLGLLGTGALVAAGLIAVVGLALWPLMALAAIVAAVSLGLYLAALWPPLSVWAHNHGETLSDPPARASAGVPGLPSGSAS